MVEADESQPIKELSPGKILLQGRLQSGLTQEQVAKELYMTVHKVKALENDDYSCLSSDTFARGYIRAYANLVKVDIVLALAAYDQLMAGLKPKETTQSHAAAVAENSHRGAWQFLAVIGAFFVGLWLISVWFFDNHTETEYLVPVAVMSSAASMEATSSVATSDVNLSSISTSTSAPMVAMKTMVVNGSSSSTKSVSGINVQASVASLVASTSSIAAVQTSAAVSAKKTSLDELSFSFRAESWLEVSDSRGDVLATELESAGSKVKLVGLAPFDVKLGNAPAVDIQLNGKKIDVIPLMGSNVLILKIGN